MASEEDSFEVLNKEAADQASDDSQVPVTSSPSASSSQTVAASSPQMTAPSESQMAADVGIGQGSNLSLILGDSWVARSPSQDSSLSFVQIPSPCKSPPPEGSSLFMQSGVGAIVDKKSVTKDQDVLKADTGTQQTEDISGLAASQLKADEIEGETASGRLSVSMLIQSFEHVSVNHNNTSRYGLSNPLSSDKRSQSLSDISYGATSETAFSGGQKQKTSQTQPVPGRSKSREDVRSHSLAVFSGEDIMPEYAGEKLSLTSEFPGILATVAADVTKPEHPAETTPEMPPFSPTSLPAQQAKSPEGPRSLAEGQRVLSHPPMQGMHASYTPAGSSYQTAPQAHLQILSSNHHGYIQSPPSAPVQPQQYQQQFPGIPFASPQGFASSDQFCWAAQQPHGQMFQQPWQQKPRGGGPFQSTASPMKSFTGPAECQNKMQKKPPKREVQPSWELPKPQPSAKEPVKSSSSSTRSAVVKVTGVDLSTDLEKLEMYFESNRRSGGGNFTNIDDQRSQGYVLITFEEIEAAERVLSRSHTLGDQQLSVAVYQPPRTIRVSGLHPSVSVELLKMYFETEKSGVEADVKGITLNPNKGEALITFSDPTAVTRVLSKNHKIKEKEVIVSLSTSSSAAVSMGARAAQKAKPSPAKRTAAIPVSSPTSTSLTQPTQPVPATEPPPCTVEVRGLHRNTCEETLINYFENKKRSHGGHVDHVTFNPDAGLARVTFVLAEDAANVVAQDHILENAKLDVRICRPPEMMKNAVLLKNLPEIKSVDELANFVEAKSALEVGSILFGEEKGMAVVIFKTDVEFSQVEKALTRHPFKGEKLTLEQVPASNTVLVSNLPQNPPPTEDTLINYFENPRHGNECGVNVEMDVSGDFVKITFADAKAASRVAGQEHVLNKQSLKVRLFMECLGPDGGSEEPKLKIPEPIPIEDTDRDKILLLQQVPAFKDVLDSLLENHHAALEDAGGLALVCCLTAEMDGACQMARTWAITVMEALQNYLGSLDIEGIAVTGQVFMEAEGSLRELTARAEFGIHYDNQQCRLFIICKKDHNRHVYNDMRNAVQNAAEKVARMVNEQTTQIQASKGKLELLRDNKILKDIRGRFPELSIVFEMDNGYVELKGLPKEIQWADQKIVDALSKFKSLPYQWTPDLASQLQKIPEAENAIRAACMDQDADGIVEFTPQGFEVHSSEQERAEAMLVAGMSTVQTWVIELEDGKDRACKLPGWEKLKRTVQERSKGKILIAEDASRVTIVGVGSTIDYEYRLLHEFLDSHSHQEYTQRMGKPMYELFQFYLRDTDENQSLITMDISFKKDTKEVVMKGSKTEIKNAKNAVRMFLEKMVCEEREFSQPSMKEFLENDNNWKRRQRPDIEQRLKCKILDPTAVADAAGATGGVSPSIQPEAFLGALAISPSASSLQQQRGSATAARLASQPRQGVPLMPRIFMNAMSDITKEEHHVLVNSTNVHLRLNKGQVSSALLKVGGPTIQEECIHKYPKGIQMGDIAVTGPGKHQGKRKLICKNLFHCCLPETKELKAIKFVVKEAVTKCLTQTEALGHKSIGFPALGTGTLKYPPDVVADTMYEAVLEYGRQNPNTQISDVVFILHSKPEDAPVRQAFKARDDQYKELIRTSIQQAEETQQQSMVNPNARGIHAYQHFTRTQGKVKVMFLAYSGQTIDKAEQELLKCYNDKVTSNYHDVVQLEQWDDVNVSTLIHACELLNVDITFNYTLSRLEFRGFLHNLDRIPLHGTMRDAEQNVQEKQNAHVMAQQVQWSTVEILEDGEQLVPYELINNYKIEMGYREGRLRVIVVHVIDNTNKSYNVDFTTFEEVPEDPTEAATATPLRVIRQDKIQDLAVDAVNPANWKTMTGLLDCVPLQPNDREYTQVAESFTRSMNRPSVQIQKIERVQNVTLYKQYMALKLQIENHMSQGRRCEQDRLWHGTNENAAEGIIKYGFNRSYSDLTRSAYGQGVYFAKEASYSSRDQYAQANSAGERNMFRCRVLVGEFTTGDQNMRFPPDVPGASPPRRYDSTVDNPREPTIFVVFSDVQAYPEYRIVFKDG